jgi:hypothetical protein
MKAGVLSEPELEFRSGNRHIDPRFGIAQYGPADADTPSFPSQIPIGLVGPRQGLDGIRRWLERCQDEIGGKVAKPGQQNMYPPFPGFARDRGFLSTIVFDDSLVREIPDRSVRLFAGRASPSLLASAVELYSDEARSLSETGRCRVIICARPDELDDEPAESDTGEENGDDAEDRPDDPGGDFHDLLKARCLSFTSPLQIIRRETWEGMVSTTRQRRRPLQDEATRAWNLHTALYYKAGGTPWRLPRRSTDLTTCFVGVSFFRTPDASELHTAVAQVFNERGDGVVVRGGAASVSKADRQPHLSGEDAEGLLNDALGEYRRVHGNLPSRVVLHKSSSFNENERSGFRNAVENRDIDHLDLLWIQRRAAPRMFRSGDLPPLRGTVLWLQSNAIVVYTRGSVPFFRTYPGMYVPAPLLIQPCSEVDLSGAASEVLALSKMNWNNAQLDERDPLTLRTAQRVGRILKHVPMDSTIATRYAFYM